MAKSSLIGRIAFDLVANTGPLLKPLKQAETAVSGFAAKINKWTGIGAAISAPIAAFFSVRGAINEVGQAFNELGSVSDESKRLGIPAEQLTALQYAAAQAGVDMDTLGKSMQTMMKKGLNPSQLGRIADELDGIGDPVLKMQTALKYFGKSGGGMINMLDGGSKKLNEMIEQAKKLGYVVTQGQADLVESAGDAWDRIKLALDGMARQMAVGLAPYVIMMADKVSEFVASLNASLSPASSLVKFFGLIADELEFIKLTWDVIKMANPIDIIKDTAKGDPGAAWRTLKDDFLGPSWSERLNKEIEKIRSDMGAPATKAGTSATALPVAASTKPIDMSPLLRGSAAALSAIMGTKPQEVAKETLGETKKMVSYLKMIAARGGFFAHAGLLGGAE